MNVRLVKHTAVYSLVFMFLVVIISIPITMNHNSSAYADGAVKQVKADTITSQENKKVNTIEQEETPINEQLGEKYLVIKKSVSSLEHVEIEDNYMDRSIRVTISGINRQVFDEESILRVNKGTEFIKTPTSDPENSMDEQTETLEEVEELSQTDDMTLDSSEITDPVKGINISYVEPINNNLHSSIIDISLDRIYAYIIYQDDENIYIDLKRPKEVYEKIVVIDAGHGGNDGGTYTEGSLYYEKDLNLSILLFLKEIMDNSNIKVYYTRTTDKKVYLNPRVNLANDLEADFFISIHCNSNESSQPNGAEVLYSNMPSVDTAKSQQLAQICLDEVSNITQRVHRGLVDGSEIHIIKKAKMPIALIEVGYMSNQDDLNFLLQENNRRKIAEAIYQVINRAYKEILP